MVLELQKRSSCVYFWKEVRAVEVSIVLLDELEEGHDTWKQHRVSIIEAIDLFLIPQYISDQE